MEGAEQLEDSCHCRFSGDKTFTSPLHHATIGDVYPLVDELHLLAEYAMMSYSGFSDYNYAALVLLGLAASLSSIGAWLW